MSSNYIVLSKSDRQLRMYDWQTTSRLCKLAWIYLDENFNILMRKICKNWFSKQIHCARSVDCEVSKRLLPKMTPIRSLGSTYMCHSAGKYLSKVTLGSYEISRPSELKFVWLLSILEENYVSIDWKEFCLPLHAIIPRCKHFLDLHVLLCGVRTKQRPMNSHTLQCSWIWTLILSKMISWRVQNYLPITGKWF